MDIHSVDSTQRIEIAPTPPLVVVTDQMLATRRSFFGGLALPVLALSAASCEQNQSEEIAALNTLKTPLTSNSFVNVKVVSRKELLDLTGKGAITEVIEEYENESSGLFTYAFLPKDSKEWLYVRGITAGADREEIISALSEKKVSINGRYLSSQQSTTTACFSYVLYTFAGVFALSLLSERRKAKLARGDEDLSSGKSKPKDRFEDVGGNRELVAEMRELVRDIKAYKNGEDVKLPHGVLITGDPGLGKTFMARVVAGEADCPFLSRNAAAMQSSAFVGSWIKEIQSLYTQARSARDKAHAIPLLKRLTSLLGKAKSKGSEKREVVIIFLDEFDSIGRARSGGGESDSVDKEYDKAVNSLLAEMDGVNEKKNRGIILMAASNFLQGLDAAFLRPGRFDKQFRLLPAATIAERLDVLQKSAKRVFETGGITIDNPAHLESIARISGGESNAHLRGILENAKEIATRKKVSVVTEADLFEAFQRQKFGPPTDSLAPMSERRLIAYHEHGHGIMGHLCKLRALIISMVPRGQTLGRVVVDGEHLTEPPLTRKSLLKALLLNAGGRGGELVYGGEDTTTNGVAQDLANMRTISRMLLASGMLGTQPSIDIMETHDRDLPDSVISVMGTIQTNAINTAKNVLSAFKREQLDQLVETSLSTNTELVGGVAQSFYDVLTGSAEFKKAEELIDQFIANPLAAGKSNES